MPPPHSWYWGGRLPPPHSQQQGSLGTSLPPASALLCTPEEAGGSGRCVFRHCTPLFLSASARCGEGSPHWYRSLRADAKGAFVPRSRWGKAPPASLVTWRGKRMVTPGSPAVSVCL